MPRIASQLSSPSSKQLESLLATYMEMSAADISIRLDWNKKQLGLITTQLSEQIDPRIAGRLILSERRLNSSNLLLEEALALKGRATREAAINNNNASVILDM